MKLGFKWVALKIPMDFLKEWPKLKIHSDSWKVALEEEHQPFWDVSS